MICAHVSGRSDPEIGKNSNRVGLIRGRNRPMMARWGSLAANLSMLAWSSQTENVQNVFRARPAFSVWPTSPAACASWRRIRMVSRMKPGMNL